MPAYLDSSVLVKRYVREPGSAEINRTLSGHEPMFVSAIAWPECLAAFSRKLHDGTLSERSHRRVCDAFVAEWESLNEIQLSRDVQQIVRDLLPRAPVRGMDAVHLASAIWAERRIGTSVVFHCADLKLAGAARERGLDVVVPGGG